MARGVRQGCPARDFAVDPIFRWLQDSIIPWNFAGLDFLQSAQCAYADDLAVAALSFRSLMTALTPAFQTVDRTAGLNLNHRKCCWVQDGSERRESLLSWLSDNCEDFREMQIVKYAKYVGTMIGPDGHIHRRTARKIIERVLKNQRLYQNPGRATARPKELCVVLLKLHGIHIHT